MLLLVPATAAEGHYPPLTTLLIGTCVLAFLVTWPLQERGTSIVSRDRYRQQANELTALLLSPNSQLPDADRQSLQTESQKDPYPTTTVLALFQRVQNDPVLISAETRYRWSVSYPLFESLARSHAQHPESTTVFEDWGFNPQQGWWPGLLTHQFLHAGWLHIFFNMLFLWAAGNVLEGALGLWFLVLYLAGGFAAAIGQTHWGVPVGQTMVGASGAIAALMGFSLFALPSARVRLFYFYIFGLRPRWGTFDSPLWFCVPLWILQQIFMLLMPLTGSLANVGYAAHVSGFVFGALAAVAYRMVSTPAPRPDDRRL